MQPRRLFVLFAVALFYTDHSASAQSPSASFDVASIHLNTGVSPNTQINVSGGRLTITNGSVKTLIRNAYDILGFQLANEPVWLEVEKFDIAAVTDASEKITQEQLRLLLQSLLAERFGLKVHWEARETQVYALVPDRKGPKIKENTSAEEPKINTRKGTGAASMKGTREPIAILASNLGNQLGRYVLDKTGLHGEYDWLLEWNPDPAAVESDKPSLFTAMQEQLGLKLEAQKGPMQTLVIDHVERPSAN